MRWAGAGWPLLLVLVGGCGQAARALGPTPGEARSHADELLGALGARFGPTEREPTFDALRPKLVRAALAPSRIFDDPSAWTEREEEARTVEFSGRPMGRYRLGVHAGVPAPAAPGEYRASLRLRRLGPGRFEWRARDELAVGGVRGSDLSAALTQLFRAVETMPPAEARLRAAESLPQTAAACGRLLALEELHLTPAPDAATAVALAVRIRPEGIERDFPRYARFLRSNVSPVRLRAEAFEPDGPRWWEAEGGDYRVALRFRVRGGDLAPLQGRARKIPSRLRFRLDYTMRPGLLGVGLQDLEGDLELVRLEDELGFRTRFARPPDWRLPFVIEPLLRASLRYPFEGEGVTLDFALREGREGPTLLAREYRLAVRESWIVTWLGGFTGSAVSDFRRGAEAEAERFTAQCLEAVGADIRALLAPAS